MDPVRDFYQNYYSRVFSKSGISSFFNSLTHKALEKKFNNTKTNLRSKRELQILEIGAGKGEHYRFVENDFQCYSMLDLLPEPTNFYEFKNARWIQGDICDVDLNLPQYDRILAMCVFHHLDDPKTALQNIKKFLKPSGTFSLFLPSDPGILNRLNRRLFVTPAAKKLGFSNYDLVNAREHRNHYWGLKVELEHQFQDFDISKKYYPFRIPLANLSLFSIWHIKSKVKT